MSTEQLKDRMLRILHRWQASFVGEFARSIEADQRATREMYELLADAQIEVHREFCEHAGCRNHESEIRERWGINT